MENKTLYILGGSSAVIAASAAVAAILWKKEKQATLIVSTAINYLGQKEIPQNAGFESSSFASKMKKIGTIRKGDEWCAGFTKLVWMESLPDKAKAIAANLLSTGTQRMARAFEQDATSKNSFFKVFS